MKNVNNSANKARLRGQTTPVILAMFPIFILAMILAYDFGEYIIVRNKTVQMADNCALAGAAIVDLKYLADNPNDPRLNLKLSEEWGSEGHIMVAQNDRMIGGHIVTFEADEMDFMVADYQAAGSYSLCTITGVAPAYWSGLFGIDGWEFTHTSRAMPRVLDYGEHMW